ncbi:MAG: AMP-dependent synthetase [Novosphingobium sp.]|nr:AMP-dependent synthetase [Novosphingobium sp.]
MPSENGVGTLQEMATATLARESDGQAIDFAGRWYTWGDLRAVADKITRLLDASGIAATGPVSLISRNHPATIAAELALIAQGRHIAFIYAFQAPAGIVRDLQRLQPAAFVMTAKDLTPEVAETLLAKGIAGIVLDELEVFAAPGLERAGPDAAARTRSGAPQIEILTSGTTGPPKQFAIAYEVIRQHHVGGGLTRPALDATATELPPALLYMPLGNISGLYTTLPVLLNGQRARLMERFTIPGWVDYVKTFRPETHGVPPSMMQQLLDLNVPAEDLASLKSMGSGAAPLAPSVQAAFEDRYGIPVLVSYGATEFGGPVAGMDLATHRQFGRAKLGTVGRAFPRCALRIVDPESGAPLGPGETGLLEVHAPRIQDEWIRTADLGSIDADGFLFLSGRSDGAIMRGGFKVLPETIERALLLHPAVAETAVVAVPDERVSQVPGAAVRLDPAAPRPSIVELSAHLREHVMATHIPVHWRIVDELPRNPSMKIDRPGVKALFELADAEARP